MWDYQALVEETHDGDTVRFLMDQGMYERTSQAIRFIGVFAPELKEQGGLLTRKFVNDWLDVHASHNQPLKWPFLIVTEKDNRSFTRFLGVISCLKCGQVLNDAVNAFLADHLVHPGHWELARYSGRKLAA